MAVKEYPRHFQLVNIGPKELGHARVTIELSEQTLQISLQDLLWWIQSEGKDWVIAYRDLDNE